MLNTTTKYDAIKYTALLTEGTYSEYELSRFIETRTSYSFPSEMIHAVMENLVNSNMVSLVDSIPCDMYLTNDPDMWENEAKKFFLAHADEFSSGEGSGAGSVTNTTPTKPKVDIPQAANVRQQEVQSTPAEEKETVKAERELSYAEKMNKNSYFNRMKEESKKKKKK